MNEYVLGLAFNNANQIILILKNRPAWQAGLHNGVGGKVENDEMPINAMVREFLEETGIETTEQQWNFIGTMGSDDWWGSDDWCVYVYKTIVDAVPISKTDEPVGLYDLNNLPSTCISNIKMWIEVALMKTENGNSNPFVNLEYYYT